MTTVFPWQEAPEAEFCVIGDPVSHSLSPRMHTAALASIGLPHRYVAVHVPRGEVAAALDRLERLGYIGVNATVPHKEDALVWASFPDPFARRVRAVNTVRFSDRSGTNTDAGGFLETLADRNIEPGRALVLGAGGSARAVVAALAENGWSLRLWNRTAERAVQLQDELAPEADVCELPDPDDCGLVVNTTSASLQGEVIAVDWHRAPKHALAYDLMYAEKPTGFLQEARRNGHPICDGRALLVAQGALALEYWLDVRAPREVMARAIA